MVDVAHQQQQLTRFPSGAALPPPVLLLPPSPQRMLTRKNSAESATTFCVAQIISAMESVFQWGCDHVTIVDVLTVRARPSTPPFTPLHSARVQHHVWWCIPCTSALDLSRPLEFTHPRPLAEPTTLNLIRRTAVAIPAPQRSGQPSSWTSKGRFWRTESGASGAQSSSVASPSKVWRRPWHP